MIKECNKHGLTEFTTRSDGGVRCKKCAVEAVIRRRNKIKILAVEYMGGKCQNPECGYDKIITALEFHHLYEDKDFGISEKGNTKSWELIKKELNKCVMLCANCHREVHGGILDVNKFVKLNENKEQKVLSNINHNIKQRKVKRPSYSQLKIEINELGYVGTGRKYNVSDNAIRNWIKYYEKYEMHR